MKKQEELQKLFDKLMTDEMKKLYKEFEDLMNLNKDKANEMLNKMKFSTKT